MTYTIMGHCLQTHQIGIGIATYSLAVGGYCPFIRANVGAVSTQAFADPHLGPLAIRLLEVGFSPDKVLLELETSDPYFDYRQLGVMDRHGSIAASTGKNTRPWSGHILGGECAAMGNGLAGRQVVQAMVKAFDQSCDQELDERLLRALEAGRDAGGQGPGEHLPERSAVLIVFGREEYPWMDLRVDAHDTAVEELRRVHSRYKPYIPYYQMRAKEPQRTPRQVDWVRERHLYW